MLVCPVFSVLSFILNIWFMTFCWRTTVHTWLTCPLTQERWGVLPYGSATLIKTDAFMTEILPSVASTGTTQRMATDDSEKKRWTSSDKMMTADWMWCHELVLGRRWTRMNPWTSKPRLGFRDVDLDAVCPLCSWVLSERSRSFGSHEASAGFLTLAVLKVQRALSHHPATPLGRPLWQRWWPLLLLRVQNDRIKKRHLETLQDL